MDFMVFGLPKISKDDVLHVLFDAMIRHVQRRIRCWDDIALMSWIGRFNSGVFIGLGLCHSNMGNMGNRHKQMNKKWEISHIRVVVI